MTTQPYKVHMLTRQLYANTVQ